MTKLHHSFSVEHAEVYGIECAIVIHHMQFWIEQNQSMSRNYYDGHTWMYQTQKEIACCYPYLSEDAVSRILKKLVDEDVLIKGNYNKTAFDRTCWYAFKNEEIFTKPRNRGMDKAKSRNPIHDNAEPIPDTNPHPKTTVCSVASPENIPVEMLKSSFCLKKHPDGSSYQVSLDDLISQSIIQNADFSLQEIEKSWDALVKTQQPVRDAFAFIKGTIHNFRKNQPNNFKSKKEKKSCLQNPTPTNCMDSQTSKMPSTPNNEQFSENVTLAQASQNFPSLPTHLKKLFNS